MSFSSKLFYLFGCMKVNLKLKELGLTIILGIQTKPQASPRDHCTTSRLHPYRRGKRGRCSIPSHPIVVSSFNTTTMKMKELRMPRQRATRRPSSSRLCIARFFGWPGVGFGCQGKVADGNGSFCLDSTKACLRLKCTAEPTAQPTLFSQYSPCSKL